jgi:hypothetical protein
MTPPLRGGCPHGRQTAKEPAPVDRRVAPARLAGEPQAGGALMAAMASSAIDSVAGAAAGGPRTAAPGTDKMLILAECRPDLVPLGRCAPARWTSTGGASQPPWGVELESVARAVSEGLAQVVAGSVDHRVQPPGNMSITSGAPPGPRIWKRLPSARTGRVPGHPANPGGRRQAWAQCWARSWSSAKSSASTLARSSRSSWPAATSTA